MNGSSTTLNEIGFEQLLKENPKRWRDFHAVITAENDEEKRNALRRKGVAADWFLSGVQAIAASRGVVGCDKTGSRVGAWPYGAGHLILVSGANKIVSSLDDALARCWEYALPVEQQRAKRVYGTSSEIGNIVIIEKEMDKDRVTLILIGESLGVTTRSERLLDQPPRDRAGAGSGGSAAASNQPAVSSSTPSALPSPLPAPSR